MSRRLGHPDPEALACFRAGMVGEGRRRRLSAHVARCPRCAVTCARLDAVLAALVSAPVPVLPSAAEFQVISAIDAESGIRASGALTTATRAGTALATRPLPAGVLRFPAPHSYARRWAVSWVARVGVTASLVAVIGCLGYLVRGAGTGPAAQAVSSSSAGAVPGRQPGGSLSGAVAPGPSSGPGLMPQREGGPAGGQPRATVFLVTDTRTQYWWSTLRAQVQVRLAARVPAFDVQPIQPLPSAGSAPAPRPRAGRGGHQAIAPASSPGAAGSPGNAASPGNTVPAEVVAPESLIGCVMHLTGNVPPEFVDRATYQARPAYVFADATEAWVVGIGCTAARPALITVVRLGNAGL